MTSDEWQRVKGILLQAQDLDTSEWPALLDRCCGGDAGLRREAEALLGSMERTGDFLQMPLGEVAAAAGLGQNGESAPGERLGPYLVLQEIGRGGMGSVYLAERVDGQYRKRVAIKVVSRHDWDANISGRFRKERQVLADLDHPNIARLLDGGATGDGQLYLVMEYVDGERIDAWCDSRKLGTRDRLKLFEGVCAAVQFAHEKLVIHRDIKPSNILVTGDGAVKLLDFGIAKVLNPDSTETTADLTLDRAPMTPQYASPEQMRGEAVGPASDVYALGVLLYRLLTGEDLVRTPCSDLAEFSGAVCDREPEKPSARSGQRELAGDLDAIVLRALSTDPEKRYRSAAALLDEVERYLQDRPVRARGPSLVYRGRKFLKRQRRLVTAAITGGALVMAAAFGLSRMESRSGVRAAPRGAVKPGPHAAERWSHLKFERIAAIGDAAPDGGTFAKAFEPWALNNRGDIAFAVDLSPGKQGVYLVPGGTARSVLAVARAGQAAPGSGTLDQGPLAFTAMNDSGDMAFSFGLNPFFPRGLKGLAFAGLYRYSWAERKLSAVVVPGKTPAPGFGVFQSTGLHASLNNSGDVAFTGVVRTDAGLSPALGLGMGIFLAVHDGPISRVAAPGDPGPDGGHFDLAQNPWINDRGDIAFGAHVAGETCMSIQSIGPGCGESIYLKKAGQSSAQSVAHQGEQAPGGSMLRWAWGPLLNNRGDLVFMGELATQRGGSARAIYLHSRAGTMPVASPGDLMLDGRTIKTVNPATTTGNYSLNSAGEVSFNAALENGDSALYVFSDSAVHLVAGTGTVMPGIGVVLRVTNLIVDGGILNDRGQILFAVTLTDGTNVLLLATPPLPAPAR